MIDNTGLLGIIGPWAKETVPDLYAATMQQAARPAALRNYLLRLIEIRADGDEQRGIPRDNVFLSKLPVSVIDETRITRTLTIRSTGQSYKVAGKKYLMAEGDRSPDLTWAMLDTSPQDFAQLAQAITALDLEVVR